MAICWMNGELMDAKQASVSVYDHGLLYGDGVFEGLRFYNARVFRASEHIVRLFESAKALTLSLPYTAEQILMAIEQVIEAYTQTQGYLRIVLTRGPGTLGIDPRNCQNATMFIIADSLSFASQQVYMQGARAITAATRRFSSDCLDPRIKSLNYLNNILARIEANQAGVDEAILLNQQGKVTEGSSDNIFIVKNGMLYTPPISDGVLAGVTRKIVLGLAKEQQIMTSECSLSSFDLYNADECILTGSAAELLPVREIDGRKMTFCPGPIFHLLNKQLMSLIDHETHSDQYLIIGDVK